MRLVPAVTRALDILDLFRQEPGELSAPEIRKRLHLPRTSVHELLQTLVARGYLVESQGETHRFRLGLRVFELGNAFAAGLNLAQEGARVAQTIAATCDETVHLAILDGTEVVYIAKVDSTQAVRMVSQTGRRLPASCTGVGKMLLSGLSDEELAARYDGQTALPTMTPRSIRSLKDLRRDLEQIRQRGYARDDCESNDAVRCVAAPVFDHTGQMAAAMSISVPTLRMSEARQVELARLVQQGALELSRRLGFPSIVTRPWTED